LAWLLASPALLAGPLRLVSLAPHITELVFAAGAGGQLVGVAEYSDYPAEARLIPRIGGHGGLDYERILLLKPDRVLVWPSGNGQQALTRLQQLGLRVQAVEPRRLEDIADALESIGQLGPQAQQAKQRAEGLRLRLQQLRQRYAGRRPVRLFYQIWDRPLMTLSGGHILNQALELCGGQNPFAGVAALTPQVSPEAVLLSQPELILLPTDHETAQRWQAGWQQLASPSRAWRFAQLNPDLLQRASPRMLDGLEQLCAAIDQTRQGAADD
jgi:iron complex transport system substrate-binding protein